MKRIIAVAILIVGAAVGSVTRASAQEPQVIAKVPFDFVVEDRTLPAGNYRIEPQGDFLLIDRIDGSGAAYVTAIPGETTCRTVGVVEPPRSGLRAPISRPLVARNPVDGAPALAAFAPPK